MELKRTQASSSSLIGTRGGVAFWGVIDPSVFGIVVPKKDGISPSGEYITIIVPID